MNYYLEIYEADNSSIPQDHTTVATFPELLAWFNEKGGSESGRVRRFVTYERVTADQTAALLPSGGYLEAN